VRCRRGCQCIPAQVVGGLMGINLCGGYKLFGVEEWWVVRSWGGNGDFKLPEVGW
jgi:hypothetical protein